MFENIIALIGKIGVSRSSALHFGSGEGTLVHSFPGKTRCSFD